MDKTHERENNTEKLCGRYIYQRDSGHNTRCEVKEKNPSPFHVSIGQRKCSSREVVLMGKAQILIRRLVPIRTKYLIS